MQFSDGTHVDLAQGARVSVLSRGPRGARLRVEEGEARFDVVHLPHAAWSVEAGPYVVYVTGTVFDVRWSGANEVIEVRMHSGSVQVGGPLLPERVTLRAGQQLTAKLASGELHIGEARGGDGRLAAALEGTGAGAPARQPVAAAPGEPPSEPGRRPSRRWRPRPNLRPCPYRLRRRSFRCLRWRRRTAAGTGGAAVCRAGAAGARAARRRHARSPVDAAPRTTARANPISFAPRTWSSAITTGHAARVVAEAEAHGLDKALLEVDSTALVALADASRYSGRPEIAVRALVAERQRFPDTPAAHSAAFFLGVSPTIAARSRRASPGTGATCRRSRRGRTRRRRWDGRCSRSSASPAGTPRAASRPNTSNVSPTERICCKPTRSWRIRRRDTSAPHARKSMRLGGGWRRRCARAPRRRRPTRAPRSRFPPCRR